MSHTPGPWEVTPDGHASYVIRRVTPPLCSHIARINDHWLCDEHGGSIDANAKLLASAPDLLEALSELHLASGEAHALRDAGLKVPASVWSAVHSANVKALAAIAKAKGVTT